MAEGLGSAELRLTVDDSAFNAGLKSAEQKAQQSGQRIQRSLRSTGNFTSQLKLTVNDTAFNAGIDAAGSKALGLKQLFARLGPQLTIAGTAAFTAQQITQLDAAAAAVRTLGVDSADLTSRLRALSAELDNNFSQIELTRAAYDVASAGFNNAADATQVLRAAALGAKGGFAEVKDVASALTGVLNAYGLSADQAVTLSDKFVQTQADGVITVRQYAAEIGNIASIASSAGVSIDELNAAIAAVTVKGVPVAQTFTGLRQALTNIVNPSAKASELAASLGLEFNAAALRAKGLGGVLADVQAATGGAADKIGELFESVEAQAAIQPLLNDALETYNRLLERQATSQGAAAEAAQTNANTISGGLKQIGNGFSNLATTLDNVLNPLFAGFIQSLNQILTKLNQVAALSPDKVLAREREASGIVQTAIGPFGGSGFFGPVEVSYGGKVYKGSATGIREAIIQDLLRKDLAALNKPGASTVKVNEPPPAPPPVAQVAQVAPDRSAIEAANALREASQFRLNAVQRTIGLEGQALQIAQQQLAVEEAKAIERQKFNAFNDAFRQANGDSNSDAVIKAAAEYEDAANNVRSALISGAFAVRDSLKQATDNLNGALRGAFDILTFPEQQKLLEQARRNIQEAAKIGKVDPSKINFNDANAILRAGQQSKAIVDAFKQVGDAQKQANSFQQANTEALQKLAEKDWAVFVTVNADGGSFVDGDPLPRAIQ